MDFVDREFVEYVVEQEADKGPDLSPYLDSNGHWTIGYGHKIRKDGENHPDITEKDAENLLRKDLNTAARGARSYVVNNFGPDAWELLSWLQKQALTDFQFNVGSISKQFPSLGKAIVENDRLRIGSEFLRWHDHQGKEGVPTKEGPDGNLKEPLTRRNKAWWNKFGKPLTGMRYKDTSAAKSLVALLDKEEIPTKGY